MFAEKLKYFQGYVKVRLTGYAPERFLNLCSNHNILIWNLLYREGNYEFFISVKGLKQLRPILHKTKTRVKILQRVGLPFLLHRYRKRKIFFGGIVLCGLALYAMSLFIWNIEIQGNLHRTDSTIIKFLEENHIYHGILKKKLDCVEIEELLRSQYDDVIWASAKIQGTRLIIDLQENLVTNQETSVLSENTPSSLTAEKDAQIYSIITRTGTPLVEPGMSVKKGDLLVEGRIPIYNDNGEISQYQYCYADSDILGITVYSYEDRFSMEYEDKTFTGNERTSYRLKVFQKMMRLPFSKDKTGNWDQITTEIPFRLGESFYLPVVLYKEVSKEYNMEKKTYTKAEVESLAKYKLNEFCEKLRQKGVQIIENNVIIVTEGKSCLSKGEITVIEPIGLRQAATISEIQQEGQITDESDGNND